MRRLIFADVHANEPALRAILEDAKHWDEAVFLGDIVGWGPHPEQCAKLLREIDPIRVLGNHDLSCCAERKDWHWDAWTYDRLTDETRKWILDCPETITFSSGSEKIYATHKTKNNKNYLSPSISPSEMANSFEESEASILLCGHCHHLIERVWNNKRYVCIRAVGQMRDGDPQTGYTIEENGRLTHYRVPYDVDKVVYDLKSIGLDEDFRIRWSNFVSTAYDPEWSRM